MPHGLGCRSAALFARLQNHVVHGERELLEVSHEQEPWVRRPQGGSPRSGGARPDPRTGTSPAAPGLETSSRSGFTPRAGHRFDVLWAPAEFSKRLRVVPVGQQVLPRGGSRCDAHGIVPSPAYRCNGRTRG